MRPALTKEGRAAFHARSMNKARALRGMILAGVAACGATLGTACQKNAASCCGDDAGASDAALAVAWTPPASTGSQAGKSDKTDDPPEEDDVDCEGEVCKVGLISENAKAELEKQSNYKTRVLRFREHTTNDQFRTIDTLPWATRVSIDGCKEVSDLSPLSELKGVKELSAEGAEQIVDLAPIAGLVDIEKLSVAKTGVESLAPIKALTKLTKLDVRASKVTDLGPIAGMTKLQLLNVSMLQAREWSPLQGLTGLKQLDMTNSNLQNAFVLGGMKDMKRLNLANSKDLKDLGPIKVMTGLEQLRIDDCPITSIAPLVGMLDLQVLSASGTKLTTIAPISNLSELRSVDLQRTAVIDFDPLISSAKSLKYLGLPKGTTSDMYSGVMEANRKVHVEMSRRR